MSYLIYLIIPVLLILLSKNVNNQKFNIADYIIMIIMSMVCGLRYNVGTDYFLYTKMYNYLESFPRVEIFFQRLITFMNSIGLNSTHFFLVTSLMITIISYAAIKKNSKYPAESLFLYVTLGFYAFQFNVIRQSLAIGIILYATKYMYDKNFLKYFILVLCASLCHTTALIMIPVYFLANINWNKKKKLIILISMFALSFAYESIINLVIKYFPTYAVYLSINDYTFDSAGVGTYLILFFNMIMFGFILKNEEKLIEYNPKNKMYINLVLFSFLFSFLGLNNTVMIRPGYYLSIYLVFILPDLYRVCKLKVKSTNSMALIIFFLIYYMVHLYFFNSMIPYKTIIFRG